MKLETNIDFPRSMIIYILKVHGNISGEIDLFLLSLYSTEI